MNKLRSIYASATGAIISIVAVTAVTIAGELSEPFKNWIKGFTGHHWITKSWLSIIVFFLGYMIVRAVVRDPAPVRVRRMLGMLVTFAFLGTAAFFILFFWEHFGR
jgi:hypothetical protein